MPNIIYTKKARKSIKSLDIRVKDGIEKIPFGDIKPKLPINYTHNQI